jgi:hypothetical protein
MKLIAIPLFYAIDLALLRPIVLRIMIILWKNYQYFALIVKILLNVVRLRPTREKSVVG